jgi:hypothetical protein
LARFRRHYAAKALGLAARLGLERSSNRRTIDWCREEIPNGKTQKQRIADQQLATRFAERDLWASSPAMSLAIAHTRFDIAMIAGSV